MGLTKVSYAMINGEVLNALDYGAVGDGSTDDTSAIQAAITAAQSNGKTVFIPAGAYKLTAKISVTSGITICGEPPVIPSTPLTAPTKGTWLYFAHDDIGIDANVNNGFTIDTIGTYRSTQVLPVAGSGTYTPTVQGADIQTTSNDYSFMRNLTMLNPYHGIDHLGGGGVFIENILMGALRRGIRIDNTADSCYIDNIHIWPFWTGPAQYTSWDYTIANLNAIILLRCDNPFISNVFTIFAHNGINFSSSAYGISSKIHMVNCDFDRGAVGIYFGASNITGQFENITIQGENTQPVGANVNGIVIAASGCRLSFGKLDIQQTGEYGIYATSAATSGWLRVADLTIGSYGQVVSAAQAVYANNSNFFIYLNGTPDIYNGGGGASYNGTLKGMGWAYSDVTASRVIGTNYTNTTNRPLYVSAFGSSSGVTAALFYVDGNQVQSYSLGAGDYCTFTCIVPPQSTYKITGFTTLTKWIES